MTLVISIYVMNFTILTYNFCRNSCGFSWRRRICRAEKGKIYVKHGYQATCIMILKALSITIICFLIKYVYVIHICYFQYADKSSWWTLVQQMQTNTN